MNPLTFAVAGRGSLLGAAVATLPSLIVALANTLSSTKVPTRAWLMSLAARGLTAGTTTFLVTLIYFQARERLKNWSYHLHDQLKFLLLFIPGSVASVILLLRWKNSVQFHESRQSLCMYLLVQTIYTIGQWCRIRKSSIHADSSLSFPIQIVSKVAAFPHLTLGLFSLTCAQIMNAWLFAPESLPKSYVKWITRFAVIDKRFLTYIRQVQNSEIVVGSGVADASLTNLALERGLDPVLCNSAFDIVPCELLHPRLNCFMFALNQWFLAWRRAFTQIYFPLQSFSFILSFRKKWQLHRVLFPAGRSASFIATFVSIIFYSICSLRQWTRNDLLGPRLACWLCGFSLILERPARRVDLVLYTAPRALISCVRFPDWIQNALIVSNAGIFMAAYETEPESVRATLRRVFDWLLCEKRQPNMTTFSINELHFQ